MHRVKDAQHTKKTFKQFADNAGSDQPVDCCQLTEFMNIEVYVDKHSISRSDCMDVHTHVERISISIWHNGLFPKFKQGQFVQT